MAKAGTQTARTRGAVIYIRVSTDDQAVSGTSPETQREACLLMASQMNLPVIAVCEDLGVSGTRYSSRPGVQETLKLIETGAASALIATKVDRIGRSAAVILDIARRVRQAGGELVTGDYRFDDTPMGQFTLTMFAGMAELERNNIRARTVGGKNKRIEQGFQPASGMRPWGYRVVQKVDVLTGCQPEDACGHYILVAEEEKWAKECFSRYAAGASLMKIGRWLQESGVEPIRGGKVWHPNTLAGILRNPVYKGLATSGKRKRVVDESRLEQGYKRVDYNVRLPQEEWRYIPAPSIVDEATWDQCQERLRDNQARLSGNNARRHSLTGLLKCPTCQRNMRSKKTRSYVHFHCRDYSAKCNLTGEVCNPKHYNAAGLEALTVRAFAILLQQPDLLTKALQAFQEASQPEDRVGERSRIEADLKGLKAEALATGKAQVRGLQAGADIEVYDGILAENAEKQRRLKARLAAIPEEAATAWRPEAVEEEVRRRMMGLEDVLVSTVLTSDRKHDLLAIVVEALVPEEDGLEVILKAAALLDDQTVKCIVIRRSGKSRPVFLIALRTRSRDS